MMFIVVALQLNQKSGYDTLKIFLCGLDKGPIIKCPIMPCFGAFCPYLQEHDFSLCKLHILQNSANRSKSMPCVVVFS